MNSQSQQHTTTLEHCYQLPKQILLEGAHAWHVKIFSFFFETEKRISKGKKNSPFVISPLCFLKKKKEFQKKGEKNSPFVISPFCLPNNASVVLQKEKRNLEKEKKMTPQSHRSLVIRLHFSDFFPKNRKVVYV